MKNRRGLSSIVGTVFAIIALATTVSYVTYSMNILEKFNNSILATNVETLDKSKEQIQINQVTIDNNKFNITASNSGNLPLHLTRLWITNTTDVDKVFKYNIDYNITPGNSQTKIGQNLPIYAKSTQAYNLKLITERGNEKTFYVNSAGSEPLNIQFLALPSTIASGFTTEMIMLVTNNGSGILTNLVPETPTLDPSSTATCVLSQVSPPNYQNLLPSGTAIFKWDLKVTGDVNQICKYQVKLQNGYPGNTAEATVTVTQVKIFSTDYATNAGILSINYTSLRWSQGNGWNIGWSLAGGKDTAFSITLNNNNSTGPLYISKEAVLVFFKLGSANSLGYNIVRAVNVVPANPVITQAYTCTGPPANDYCISIPPKGSATLYFAATVAGGNSMVKFPTTGSAVDQYTGFLIMFGKYSTSQNGPGTLYAQNLPYIGLLVT